MPIEPPKLHAEPTFSPVSSHGRILNPSFANTSLYHVAEHVGRVTISQALYEITPIVNEPRTHHLSTRRDQSVFNRCRIGHSRLTREFLLKGEPSPECIPCNYSLTSKHLLIECVDFNDVRQRFYQVPSLQDLFKTVKPEVILEFLKAAALYRLL